MNQLISAPPITFENTTRYVPFYNESKEFIPPIGVSPIFDTDQSLRLECIKVAAKDSVNFSHCIEIAEFYVQYIKYGVRPTWPALKP